MPGGEIITYSGGCDFYERERAVRESNQQAAFARQQSMLAEEQRFIDRYGTRLAIACMLYNPPNFPVLDEPTNHLDLATKEMLVDA